jgi:hypothetical protein
MARTKRAVPYKHYWGSTKAEKKRDWEKYTPCRWGYQEDWYKREYLLHGTDAKNYTFPTHEWFNFAHRVGRRVARDQLRPHIVLGEDYEFDDSRYCRKLKGVWWEIY